MGTNDRANRDHASADPIRALVPMRVAFHRSVDSVRSAPRVKTLDTVLEDQGHANEDHQSAIVHGSAVVSCPCPNTDR